MSELEQNIAQEIAALKEKFEKIKAETEEFLASVKTLSDKGVGEAKDLIERAHEPWHSIVSAFESSSVAQFFNKGKKKVAKAKSKSAAKKKKAPAKAAKKKPVAKKKTAKKKK
jgi:hypothetical protein